MSRAVHREQLPGRWDPPALQGGDGAIVEGELVAVSRHLLSDVNGRKERYYVLYVRPSQLHRRRFDAQGNEREPNFSDTRKVNTGFLMSSFKVEAKGSSDRLSLEELKGLVNKPELLSVTARHTPSQTVAFWLLETELEKMELELGTQIRLKTQGDSPFIYRLGLPGQTTSWLTEPKEGQPPRPGSKGTVQRRTSGSLALQLRPASLGGGQQWALRCQPKLLLPRPAHGFSSAPTELLLAPLCGLFPRTTESRGTPGGSS
ncbi:arpin isoform X5 [Carettochelys insculpta]|uniref:arpin isoform X5 n=1 Tax=Carettochelys insculpta TaxID=44489 RepID=UPI003EC02B2D